MLSTVFSSAILGLDAHQIEIEADITQGLPSVTVVGLADTAVKESKDRVKSAIKNSGYHYPADRITINLAPADIKKEGVNFDLAIALGVLASSQQLDPAKLRDFCVLGELALDGKLRPVKGALPVALGLRKGRIKKLILPKANANEAAAVKDIEAYGVENLTEAVGFLSGDIPLLASQASTDDLSARKPSYDTDFCDVKAQALAKRALEIAASGAHNILLIGPPGAGKSMLAKRLPTILPDMTFEEILDVSKIYSISGLLMPGQVLVARRPFREPHHTASNISLVGGGAFPKPGEISLAHNGVLFMDELPEFHRDVLEVLRQPIEDGFVNVSRISRSERYPSRFMFVAAMNPCPCGYFGDTSRTKSCRCTPAQVQKYRNKISGPLLDRIDMHIEVPVLKSQELMRPQEAEPSKQIKKRVDGARKIQLRRFSAAGACLPDRQGSASGGKKEDIRSNSQMNHKQVKKYCRLGEEAQSLLRAAINELGFSARAYDKVLKIGRTIADLANSKEILPEHISEAVQYRSLDRNFWA